MVRRLDGDPRERQAADSGHGDVRCPHFHKNLPFAFSVSSSATDGSSYHGVSQRRIAGAEVAPDVPSAIEPELPFYPEGYLPAQPIGLAEPEPDAVRIHAHWSDPWSLP